MAEDTEKNRTESISLVFPHQLFFNNPSIHKNRTVYIIEEYLFFNQYNFHKTKIAFHRASMKFYENHLKNEGFRVIYIDAFSKLSKVRNLITFLSNHGLKEIYFCDVVDDWLEQRIKSECKKANVKVNEFESPLFINTKEELKIYFNLNKRLHQTDFYIYQRKLRNILLDKNKKPFGGKWTYDKENRLKYPSDKPPQNQL